MYFVILLFLFLSVFMLYSKASDANYIKDIIVAVFIFVLASAYGLDHNLNWSMLPNPMHYVEHQLSPLVDMFNDYFGAID
ncbi:hypothetical protein SYNTR_1942 [Candidatus Syntrophocurvum alkaliphilum]|uniref:Uncharacterized protein n=1 Tax=Candidatus Syntrophocurvum alkaliphilum TaxID=2293317 RepID=A0A6I6DEL4_9FIRM|nr:hypothetical protein [Candidatus Syntrophocurvum alkaliphilum]QGU00536.1 hypothetical protein SYNTR_1942 [Candidatus Syntrophocurvum alkaliphilum]